ncbi:M20 family metallo-hydrolase [Gudongella sp. DL1XJH-153]|uniref:M20 family metallo-hydrolase n=1 Tax=Gudongella sp. DL1XJH-153 TaxID=3409804 RepID=UPI003BB6A059
MKINMERVKRDINNLASFSSTPGRGVTRLAFSKEDIQAKGYLMAQMEAAGLHVYQDGYGSLFGRREGTDPDLPTVMIGSHYDTGIGGGPFDGVAGVIAGIEIARVLKENNISHRYPIEIAAFNDEEGARFGNAMSNTRAMAGLLKEDELDSTKDINGKPLREAMQECGIKVDLESAKREKGSIKSFFELHIEQGPVLEESGKDVGIVDSVVGLDRYEVRFKGLSGHAGTTPMLGRKDALVSASKFIVAVNEIAREAGKDAVATVGEMSIYPNASNVIPQLVKLSVDIRATESEVINRMSEMINEELEKIKYSDPVEIDVRRGVDIPPVKMSDENAELLKEKASELGLEYHIMNSGAAHDAMVMAALAPSNIVFVPSVGGVSHRPEEWTEYEDLGNGMELMLHSIIQISK